jgi:hypothetical protein
MTAADKVMVMSRMVAILLRRQADFQLWIAEFFWQGGFDVRLRQTRPHGEEAPLRRLGPWAASAVAHPSRRAQGRAPQDEGFFVVSDSIFKQPVAGMSERDMRDHGRPGCRGACHRARIRATRWLFRATITNIGFSFSRHDTPEVYSFGRPKK